MLEEPYQPLDKVVQTEGKFWAGLEPLDALKSGSRGLVENPFVGIGRCRECEIDYNSGSKKTNVQNSQMKNLSLAAW